MYIHSPLSTQELMPVFFTFYSYATLSAQPLHIIAAGFTVKNVGQTVPYPGCMNTITVTAFCVLCAHVCMRALSLILAMVSIKFHRLS